MFAACSHAAPETAAAPLDEPAPIPVATALTPTAAAGNYRLSASIQASRARSARSGQGGIIQLSGTPTAAPMGGSAPGTQFNATIALSGFTRAPRGRAGQGAVWWPIGGDSVAIQFTSASAGEIQLRGAVRGRTIQGEVWYLSAATGSTFQMGTFTATKGR